KAGAISGVVLIGATGALVGVSSQRVVTTAPAEQFSASPSALSAPQTTPEPSESPDQAPSAAKPLSVATAADACTSQTAALAPQIQRVDSAFTLLRSDLMKLRGTRAKSALERADVSLKRIHQGSILALRTSVTCARPDDEDEADSDTDTD